MKLLVLLFLGFSGCWMLQKPVAPVPCPAQTEFAIPPLGPKPKLPSWSAVPCQHALCLDKAGVKALLLQLNALADDANLCRSAYAGIRNANQD